MVKGRVKGRTKDRNRDRVKEEVEEQVKGRVKRRPGRPRNASRDRRAAEILHGGGNTSNKSEPAAISRPVIDQNAVDLNSRSAMDTANIVFRSAQQHQFPIIQFKCYDCVKTCEQIREWLQSAGPPDIRPLIRIEDQKLDLIGSCVKGSITLLESAATLEGNEQAPISLLVMHTPTDKHLRYFWTLLSPSPLLTNMTNQNLISAPTVYKDGPVRYSPSGSILPPRHHTLFTFLAQSFQSATAFPDSPDYQKASQIADVCPSILHPTTALHNIEFNKDLNVCHDPSKDHKDLSDDRYILELHEAERTLASLVNAGCAEYLLVKRQYFKTFSRETVLHAEKVRRAAAHNHNQQRHATPADTETIRADNDEDKDVKDEDDNSDNDSYQAGSPNSTPIATRSRVRSDSATPGPAGRLGVYHAARSSAARIGAINRSLRVRTVNAHIRTAEELSGWSFQRAKKLMIGWEILGFLDEERVLAVLDGQDDESEEE